MTILLTKSGFNQMIVILDLLGSLDLLQIGIHAFFYRTLYDLTSFFMVIAIKKKKKNVEELQKDF
jgi:hypothetical protein